LIAINAMADAAAFPAVETWRTRTADFRRNGSMTISALMVYVGNSEHSAACLELACDIADRFDATLIGITANMPEPAIVDPYAAGAYAGELLAAERDVAEVDMQRARTLFSTIAGPRGHGMGWRSGIDFPSSLMSREARAADLLIIGRDAGDGSPYHAPDAGDVALDSGRPVLLVPPKPVRSPLGTGVIVAWKETREARRAIADALPFLRQARLVSVVELCEPDDEAGGRHLDDVVAYLVRHGIKAEALVRHPDGLSPADRLAEIAEEKQAGLIVMGAYGHSRLRERTFGGVTREMLKACPVCVFLSH
jgi:nucleotide-binding universal stress UspA family protein